MTRKFIVSLFISSIFFGQDLAFTKTKHYENKNNETKKIVTASVEKKEITKNSRLDKTQPVKIKKENKKQGGFFSKYFNKSEKPESRKERAAKKAAKLKAEKDARMARRDQWRKEQNKIRREIAYKNQMRKEKLIQEKQMASKARKKAMKKWRAIRLADIQNDYQDGKFADLYKKPAWPKHMLFAERDNMIHATAQYDYATNWFNSQGSTQDLSAEIFGEQSFTFSDIFLALELVKRQVGGSSVLEDSSGLGSYFTDVPDGLYDKTLVFHGEMEKIGSSIVYSRYVKDKDVLIGLDIPFGYKSHKLKVGIIPDMSEQGDFINQQDIVVGGLNWLLKAKGLIYLPKSSITGIGDISTFINFNIRTKYLEQFKWGVKVFWPTAKGADSAKLWAPKLGEGFSQIKLFTALMFNKQSYYFNPHMFVQGTYFVSGHKNKRVPKIITYDGSTDGTTVGADTMAYGDLVKYEAIPFSEPDSKIVVFADNVKNVKIRPGAQVEFRVGNIVEKVISRRGFVDLYYDFRAKWEDDVINTGLDASTWQTDRLAENTTQIEHKLGADFSYQFDIHTSLNLGAKYTFAGINVADTFSANCGVSVEF